MAANQGARTRRRLSTAERREQLLSVGARLFSDSPYDEVW
ncbi:TetR/AcrR family transcriptional regulator, partial [Streptomyces coelicoflavus]|nr:TetR/AcrR family transcriptional regulator [Streptomyces coelicoflavus]